MVEEGGNVEYFFVSLGFYFYLEILFFVCLFLPRVLQCPQRTTEINYEFDILGLYFRI